MWIRAGGGSVNNVHHPLCVTCHKSYVRCYMSHDKVVELVGGGSIINGATPSSFEKKDKNMICLKSVAGS